MWDRVSGLIMVVSFRFWGLGFGCFSNFVSKRWKFVYFFGDLTSVVSRVPEWGLHKVWFRNMVVG